LSSVNDTTPDAFSAMQEEYGDPRLLDVLAAEFAAEPVERRFSAAELASIDQLHTRGYAATVDFAASLDIVAETRVLDIGAGLGGPARYLAETFGCRVVGIDATEELVRASQFLTQRWSGDANLVDFSVGDALNLPYEAASFDLIWMQHVAMNIRDRDALYHEICRVLRPGGRCATYDVISRGKDLCYPTPWARSADVSTVLTSEETRVAFERAGFAIASWRLDTPAALEWVKATESTPPSNPPPRGMRVLRAAFGENFRDILANLGKNYREDRADVLVAIAESGG